MTAHGKTGRAAPGYAARNEGATRPQATAHFVRRTLLLATQHLLTGFLFFAMTGSSAAAQVTVLQNRYDDSGTSANLHEMTLKPSLVNVRSFGKLWSDSVDGAVYAQPLYVSSLSIAGRVHNVLYVATMNDKLYALDADHKGPPLWVRDFTDPAAGIGPVPIVDITHSNRLNIVGNVGILSTPVIGRARHAMYVLARTKEKAGCYVQRLHEIDITSGKDMQKPTVIQASIPSSARDAFHGVLRFDPLAGNQRAALALVNGAVIIAWASHEDLQPYHGWIMAYDAVSLKQISALCLTPEGEEGGVWQSGRAPAVDSSGDIYFQTGNGTWDGKTEFGNSVLRLALRNHRLEIADYFTPDNYLALNQHDADLGSSGPLLIPHTHILICGSKQGLLYLLDTHHLGQEHSGNPGLLQTVTINGGWILGGLAYWDGPEGPLVYLWSEYDFLKAFRFKGTTLDPYEYARGDIASTGSPGGDLTISADGDKEGTGIVWAVLSAAGSANHGNVPGMLRAFNAQTLKELWNSDQDSSRDQLGTLVKFVPPVVANGKVYAATYDNAVRVYGLLPSDAQRAASPSPTVNVESHPSSAVAHASHSVGRQLFTQCATCHAGNPSRRMGPSLGSLFRSQKLLNGKPVTDGNVRDFILNGGNGMPAYKDVLSPDQVRDLLAYLHTLKSSH